MQRQAITIERSVEVSGRLKLAFTPSIWFYNQSATNTY